MVGFWLLQLRGANLLTSYMHVKSCTCFLFAELEIEASVKEQLCLETIYRWNAAYYMTSLYYLCSY